MSPAASPTWRVLSRVALASFVGTTIEWYDFYIYGTAAALFFNQLFFPTLSPLGGILASYSTYAVAFVARPVGGVLFGHFGDRLGRKSSLVLALTIMGVASTLIGLLPTYRTRGNLAPAALVVLRFAQGLAVGGEWGGAVLLATEHAPVRWRGLFGAWPQMGAPAGLILASLAFRLVSGHTSEAAFLDWAWRVPFLASVLLLAIGLFIRLNVLESPAFLSLIHI